MPFLLYLMRHGIAENRSPSGMDFDRALTPQGEQRTRLVAERLSERTPAPLRILSSPYRRARQTANIMREVWCPHLEVEEVDFLRVETTMAEMTDGLLTVFGQSVLCVGHEPSMGMAASWLQTGDPRFPWEMKKAAVAAFETQGGNRPGARFLWYVIPRILIGEDQ